MRLGAVLLALLLLAAPAAAQEDAAARQRPEAAAEPELALDGHRQRRRASTSRSGVALCRLVNQHRRETGLRCAARPSEGSVGNITALRDGSYDLAIVQSDTQAAALERDAAPSPPPGRSTALRSVASLYPEPLTVVARADAGIAGLEDLAGKRVALGHAGLGHAAPSPTR